jgi:hypothetical protein
MSARRTGLAIVIAALLAHAPVAAQEYAGLALRVVAHQTGEPIAGVQVSILGQPRTGLSDASGVVRIAGIAPGPHAVSIERIGYASERLVVDFTAGESTEGEVELNPQAVNLAAVSVAAEGSLALRSSGFFERRKLGVGTFVTRDQVDARARVTTRMSSLLERLPGLRVLRRGASESYVASHRGSSASNSRCILAQVYLDGMRIGGGAVDVDALTSLHNVEAVEWYPGVAGLPTEFNISGFGLNGAPCGTLLIWTRKGP